MLILRNVINKQVDAMFTASANQKAIPAKKKF